MPNNDILLTWISIVVELSPSTDQSIFGTDIFWHPVGGREASRLDMSVKCKWGWDYQKNDVIVQCCGIIRWIEVRDGLTYGPSLLAEIKNALLKDKHEDQLTCVPLLESRYRAPATIFSFLVYPELKQCRAHKIVYSLRIIPPQKWCPLLVLTDTCQGIGWIAAVPPTILSTDDANQLGMAAIKNLLYAYGLLLSLS